MKLLLIGGTGFFGKSILDAFKRNILDIFHVSEIIVVSRNSKNFKINYRINQIRIIRFTLERNYTSF